MRNQKKKKKNSFLDILPEIFDVQASETYSYHCIKETVDCLKTLKCHVVRYTSHYHNHIS